MVILGPRAVVRTALRDEPRIVLAGVGQRRVIGELQIHHLRDAVDHLARRDRAAHLVARGLLDAKVVRVTRRLRAPLGLDCPLRNQQLRRAPGLRFERNGNARDFLEPRVAVVHMHLV